MLTVSELETLYQNVSRDRLDILVEIHNLVAEIAPSAAVDVHPHGLTYFHAERGGHVSAGICQTIIMPDHIRLAFIHGAAIPDPKHLLEGKTYPKRYLRIDSFDTAPWEDIKKFIQEHSVFDPYAWSNNH